LVRDKHPSMPAAFALRAMPLMNERTLHVVERFLVDDLEHSGQRAYRNLIW